MFLLYICTLYHLPNIWNIQSTAEMSWNLMDLWNRQMSNCFPFHRVHWARSRSESVGKLPTNLATDDLILYGVDLLIRTDLFAYCRRFVTFILFLFWVRASSHLALGLEKVLLISYWPEQRATVGPNELNRRSCEPCVWNVLFFGANYFWAVEIILQIIC